MTQCFMKSQALKLEPTYYCESMACFRDRLLLGTKQGLILVYKVSVKADDGKNSDGRNECDVSAEFCHIIKDPNRKPITQVEVIEEFSIILSLSDGIVSVFHLNNYKLISTIDSVKSVSKFCVDLYKFDVLLSNSIDKKVDMITTTNRDDIRVSEAIISDVRPDPATCRLRICLIAKRQLVVILWDADNNCFNVGSSQKLHLQQSAKTVQFLCEFIVVATKYEYIMYSIDKAEPKPLYNVGKCQEPFIFRIADMAALKIDETLELIDKNGRMLDAAIVRWSFIPTSLLYHPPFVVAINNRYCEIRMVSPPMNIQSFALENASLVCRNLSRIYLLCDKKVFLISSIPRKELVQSYSKSEAFDLALLLAKTAPLVGENEIDCRKYNVHFAKSLFKNRQFEKSFNIFYDLEVDPFHVLYFYPPLCPEKVAKSISNKLLDQSLNQDFDDCDKTEAIHSLVKFLVRWRSKLRKLDENEVLCLSMENLTSQWKPKTNLQEIIDTSLVRCYLIINSPLVAPLLRQENFCHLEETKKFLIKYEKPQELIMLYESHGCHEEALNYLHSESVKSHSPLYGSNPTIQYLRNLEPRHLDLIFQYGNKILKDSPLSWLSLFTDWKHKEESSVMKDATIRYKEFVLSHLEKNENEMVIPFLERMIYETSNVDEAELEMDNIDPDRIPHVKPLLLNFNRKETLPICEQIENADIGKLHCSYAVALIKNIKDRRSSNLFSVRIEDEKRSGFPDSVTVYELRMRLKYFLMSKMARYDPQIIISKFPYDALFEERAVVLARSGKHEQALTLWIYVLNDWPQAEAHCNDVYESNRDIFFKFLNVCIEPSDPASIGIILSHDDDCHILDDTHSVISKKFQPKMDVALELLKKYSNKMVVSPTIKLLASSFMIRDLYPFVRSALQVQSAMLNHVIFLRNLQFYNKMLSRMKASSSAKNYFVLTENSKCDSCGKVMGGSAVARHPDETLVHYGCCKNLPRFNS